MDSSFDLGRVLDWIGVGYARHGLRKPRAGFPALKRASLRRAMTEEKTGTAAEVPPERAGKPLTTTA